MGSLSEWFCFDKSLIKNSSNRMKYWKQLRSRLLSHLSRKALCNRDLRIARVPQLESLERRFAFDATSFHVESQQYDDDHVLVQVADRSEVHLKNALPASTQFEAISSDGWYRVRVQDGQM